MASIALVGLAACGGSGGGGGGGGGGGSAGFEPADIEDVIFAGNGGSVEIDGNGGFIFSATIDPVQGGLVQSDLAPQTPALDMPTSGSATMEGGWALTRIFNVVETNGVYSGERENDTGEMTLTANFGSGDLTGGGDGLTIDGGVANGQMSGVVTYGGVQGNLTGIIGGSEAIGLFVSQSGTAGYAGGFAVAE